MSSRIHASVTLDRVAEAVMATVTTLSDPGFCIECGTECYGVEPDARGYRCAECTMPAVYGAEELLMMLL